MASTVLFCHGLESGPIGRKSEALRAAGYDVLAPDCRGQALAERLETVEPVLAGLDRPVVVGSSYGGLVAVIAVRRALRRGQAIRGLVLCAPALHIREPPADREPVMSWSPDGPRVETVVLHGVHDDIVPVEVGRAFAAQISARLLELDDNHGLGQSTASLVAEVGRLLADPSPGDSKTLIGRPDGET